MMLGIGLLWKKHPPKKINCIYGYRTNRSMKSQETWDFAHKQFGSMCIPCGAVTAVISAALMFIFKDYYEAASVVLLTLQCIVICFSIIPVEKKLKENFDDNGKAKK